MMNKSIRYEDRRIRNQPSKCEENDYARTLLFEIFTRNKLEMEKKKMPRNGCLRKKMKISFSAFLLIAVAHCYI